MNGRIACVLSLLLCISSATASAQDKGDTGLAISIPTAVGVIWHPSDRLAVRPDFTFGLTESDGEGSIPDISSRSFTFGIGALLYTHRWDELRTYVSPRFSYSQARDSSRSANPLLPESEITNSTYSATGSFGAQYSLSRKFSVYGEVGFGYTRGRLSGLLGLESTQQTWGTHSGVGLVFYF